MSSGGQGIDQVCSSCVAATVGTVDPALQQLGSLIDSVADALKSAHTRVIDIFRSADSDMDGNMDAGGRSHVGPISISDALSPVRSVPMIRDTKLTEPVHRLLL